MTELARLAGIHINNLPNLKTGKARMIRFDTLLRICDELDCTAGDLIEVRLKSPSAERYYADLLK